jgi:hypothetical protein
MPDGELNTVAVLAPADALLQDSVFFTEPEGVGASRIREQGKDLHAITSFVPIQSG